MHKIKSFLRFIKEQNRSSKPKPGPIHFAMGQKRGNSRMRNEDVGSIPDSIDVGSP